MNLRLFAILLTFAVLYFINAAIAAADLSFSVGAFRFKATDYYFPNFYEEAGYRAEITYSRGAVNRHTFRLRAYVYPGDDNIFEPLVEYGYNRELSLGGWELVARPIVGLAVVKLQYPAPYYPTVEHQFLPWLRAGYDASIGHNLVGPIFVRGGDRGRFLYYLASSYTTFTEDKDRWQNAPFGEVELAVAPKWRLVGRGGLEVGGYYDDVFSPKDKKLRPFAEAGFAYSF